MKISIFKIIFLNLLLLSSLFSSTFEEDIKALDTKNFNEKESIVSNLATNYSEDDRLVLLLTKMLDGDLYIKNDDKDVLVLVKKEANSLFTKSLISGKDLESLEESSLEKVKTNNKLRSVIKSLLAQIDLFSSNIDKRLSSAKNILQNVSKDEEEIINKALSKEKNSDVKEILFEAKYIIEAKYYTGETQLNAVKNLGSFISSNSLATLKEISQSNESSEELKKVANSSLADVENIRTFYSFLETAFFGLSQGSVLLLAAIGLAITFGVMKVINMAHGELIMIGAYTTYTIQQLMPNLIEYSIIIAIPVAFIVSALVGILIERLVIRHLYGRPLETLLATFGISLILQQVVRTIFSPLNQEVKTPSWMSGALEINSALSLTYNRLYIVIFALVVFLAVLFVMKKTSLGLKVRAVSQNRPIARAMGIKSSYIDAITFGIGSGIAGVAGVALSQLTNVGPNLGQAYIVDSFMVVVFGGVGNLWGTLIAAFSLGEINKFIEPFAGAVLAKVIILVFIILFIQKKPRGLFPQKGRDVEE
ncbi:urea ABC transporter permease subunit UrtB [Aliarcobacter butzleri]|uniref:urea ABC transporter permease subunit UrtB n=1 Tax=Aliarcobacter butzleri TaxID=28197 RepID=UPI0021B311EE|nr:urea ABC transporter permease subunit UrtB [Aliarcobacter butzleri]MCT7577505.1 urea ABC transporter permease subunit UrtB [Aliarcobacter butzleri]MCT7593387.1 urea ABC transporter permease subunit UrtB [Aliarcobacter butzleri]